MTGFWSKRWAIFALSLAVISVVPWIRAQIHRRRPEPVSGLQEEKVRLSPDEKNEAPIYAKCENGHRGFIEFSGRVIALDEFLDYLHLRQQPEEVVRAQLRYLEGYYNHGMPETSKQTAFVYPRQEIHVTRVARTRYPRALQIQWTPDTPELYPPSFRGKRAVDGNSPATEIDYSARQEIIVCGGSANSPETGPLFKLPLDPYLAFWLVPERERQHLMNFGGERSRTNPCADPQMAKLKFPSMYWYVWSPDASGEDAEGQTFSCPALLKEGRDYATITPRFRPLDSQKSPLSFAKLSTHDSLDVRVIQGLYSQSSDRSTLDRALALFRRNGDILRTARLLGSGDLSREGIKDLDPSVFDVLRILRSLDSIADLQLRSAEDKGTHFEFAFSGQLKASQKKLDLLVYYGPTDEPQKKAKHWDFLSAAISKADFIVYSGHSGMGKNMSMNYLPSRPSTLPSYQALMVISCYASSYFGPDYLALRDRPGMSTDLIKTAISDSHPMALPGAFLQFLDQEFVNQPVSLEKSLQFGIHEREIVSFQRQER